MAAYFGFQSKISQQSESSLTPFMTMENDFEVEN